MTAKRALLVSGMILLVLAVVVFVAYTLFPSKVGAIKYPISLVIYDGSESYLIEVGPIDTSTAIRTYKGESTDISSYSADSLEIKQYLESVETSSSAWLSDKDLETLDKALAKLPATPKERKDVMVSGGRERTLFFNGKAYKLLGDEMSGDVYNAVNLIISMSPLPIVVQEH